MEKKKGNQSWISCLAYKNVFKPSVTETRSQHRSQFCHYTYQLFSFYASQTRPAVKMTTMMAMMMKHSALEWRLPLKLTKGEMEEKMALLSFLGTNTLQMFPSQQEEHTWGMRGKPITLRLRRHLKAELSTYLVASIGNVSTASEQTLLQGGTALGHRHTFPTSIHHVEGGAVFSIWRTVKFPSCDQLCLNNLTDSQAAPIWGVQSLKLPTNI